MIKSKKLQEANIPTSSMADIAFLLLLFFLVATVIDVDTGIALTLPEISNIPPQPVSDDRMAAILINENNEVLMDKVRINVNQIKDILKPRLKQKIDQPKEKKLIVSVKTDRQTNYSTFISALDQIKGAYSEVRDEYSFERFGRKYNDLDEEGQYIVKQAVPVIISLAEPEQVR